jgi:hypothetical protein
MSISEVEKRKEVDRFCSESEFIFRLPRQHVRRRRMENEE